jgi:hypothetical protein
VSFSYRENNRARFGGTGAVLAFILCLAGSAFSAFGQSTEPLKTIIPVHIDGGNGNITVGTKTFYGGVAAGAHLLTLKRQPNSSHLDAPDVINDVAFPIDGIDDAVHQFLVNTRANNPDALLIVIGFGEGGGFVLGAYPEDLEYFGASKDLENYTVAQGWPYLLIGNGGLNIAQAWQEISPTYYTAVRNVDGYVAPDSNGNYTFIETDFVRYDITPDGTITIGGKAYTAADSFRNGGCDVSNSFRLVVADRATLNVTANNSYCTAESDDQIGWFIGDLSGAINETQLVFIGTNGHPIPTNWNFGNDGDPRFQGFAKEVAQLGGYWETVAYLTPNDAFSLVGSAAPPTGTPAARSRARESSSVYPDHPTGELHGELARIKRNLWYSPLDADPTGLANLGFYQILAQSPVAFPHPNPAIPDEVSAYQYISQQLCGNSTCSVRDQYRDLNVDFGQYYSQLQGMQDPNTKQACPDVATSAFCIVRQQLLTEFKYIDNIQNYYKNLQALWLGTQAPNILSILSDQSNVEANLPTPPPPSAPTPSLGMTIANVFLSLLSYLPEVGPVFGVVDTAMNVGNSLYTDSSGNQTISLATNVGQLENQAIDQFTGQGNSIATMFDFIYQDWGKIQSLGSNLVSAQSGSPWYWDTTAASQILSAMKPGVEAAYYRSLMSNLYAIGSFMPTCPGAPPFCKYSWPASPIYLQPLAYTGGILSFGYTYPFLEPAYNYGSTSGPYVPYTFPTDSSNPYQNPSDSSYTQGFSMLLADTAWLGISLQSTPQWGVLYQPPGSQLLAHLFTPKSKGGLGVYLPAFFEGWPFPRVTCTASLAGGCNWASAAPAPEAVQGSLTSISIAPGVSTNKSAVEGQIEVPLNFHNNGTTEIKSILINNVSLRTLAGEGKAVLAHPALPVHIGAIQPGTFKTVNLRIKVPSGVKKLVIAEEGSVDSGEREPYRFSFGQVVFPDRQR